MSHDTEPTLTEHEEQKTPAAKPVLLALCAVFIFYLILAAFGLPQKWANAQLAPSHEEAAVQQADTQTPAAVQKQQAEPKHEEHATGVPPIWMIIPFCALLLCIAVLPLIPATEHWWESNLNRFIVAAVLGFFTLGYYAFICDFPIALHFPSHAIVNPSQGALAMGGTIFVNSIINEYIAFIVLLFALFTISGGIRISGDLKASPFVNSIIMLIGAVLASFVGTTGAAMLMIRLLLETNKERKFKAHTVIFFIFCVCNCGGCLLPIGDPPLFLGYLRGVDFLWTFSLWKEWVFVNGITIVVYFLMDSLWYYRKESKTDKQLDNTARQPLKIRGLFPNVFCLIGVILSVMFLAPGKEICGFNPWMFLREIAQLLLVAISLLLGSHTIRAENKFNYAAICEVAALFFGIFICMQAPLQILNASGGVISQKADQIGSKIGLDTPQQFFWMTGSLSSVLDNAPTYVVFFETARAAEKAKIEELKKDGKKEEAQKLEAELKDAEKACGVPIPLHLLAAVSLGAVFMGSMTYIGNGPNFMVKAIAEQSGVKMPSFFGYMVYSILILFPILIAMTLIFL
ncbi:MAG: sodium:proton antiporter [Planctomycetia bacterium]|nr:sodium:proton antiporter [Planctomycetia bacterium]